jgi:predicted dinucleotide-binding enzyme
LESLKFYTHAESIKIILAKMNNLINQLIERKLPVIGRRRLFVFAGITVASAWVSKLTMGMMSMSSSSNIQEDYHTTGNIEKVTGSQAKLRIGVIGAGWLGGTVGSLLVKAGHQVMLSSRHPEELMSMAKGLGERASVGTPKEAATFGTVLLFAVPYDAIPQLGIDLKDAIKGKIVIDACNGGSGDLGSEVIANGAGPTTAKYLAGARIVRAFSSEDATSIESSFSRSTKKLAIPIAGNDKEALAIASQLVIDTGCEPVIVGDLSTAVKFQRNTNAFRVNATAIELRRLLGLKDCK